MRKAFVGGNASEHLIIAKKVRSPLFQFNTWNEEMVSKLRNIRFSVVTIKK